eukprot:m.79949 g.79949  ORF g.79949 m.79949 type:complete len:81 (-) comp8019_c0_seq1:315-557(-)
MAARLCLAKRPRSPRPADITQIAAQLRLVQAIAERIDAERAVLALANPRWAQHALTKAAVWPTPTVPADDPLLQALKEPG